MADYTYLTVSNAATVYAAVTTAGVTTVQQLSIATRNFSRVALDADNDILTAYQSDGTVYVYEAASTLTVALATV